MGEIEGELLASSDVAGAGTSDDASAGAAAAEEDDPVKRAKDDAWLAQFRADNAMKVAQHNYEAAEDTQKDARGEAAKRDYELEKAKDLTDGAAKLRAEAAELEAKAEKEPTRHDEYVSQASFDRHKAQAADEIAAQSRTDAATADAAAKRLEDEAQDLYKTFQENEAQARLMQEQAVAAGRIATDEAKIHHVDQPAPVDQPAAAAQPAASEPPVQP
jgi:hypothetical protein